MRRFASGVLVSGLVLSLAACGAEAPSAPSVPSLVTNGTPDPGHPYVGTLLFVQNGVGYYSCTGTLLTPTVMLTAGHCVESEGNTNDVTWVRFDQDALQGLGDYRTTDAWLKAKWIKASKVIPHPQFDDFADFPDTYDVGIVILSKAVTLPTYGALPAIGLLDQLANDSDMSNNLFTAVGYGQQGDIKPFYSDDYARYQVSTRLIEAKSTYTGGTQSAKFSNNPGEGNGEGGTCYGDSGGPIFAGTSNVIGAITSFGFTPCIGVDFNFRVDTRIAQDFIRQYVK